jgi:hypothetical protein
VGQPHAVAVLRPVTGGDQKAGLVYARLPSAIHFDGQRDVRRTKASQHLQQRDHVSAMRAQPARLLQRSAVHGRIQAGAGNGAEKRGARGFTFGLGQAAQLRFHNALAQFFLRSRQGVAPRTVGHEVQRLQRLALPRNGILFARLASLVERLDGPQVDAARVIARRTETPPCCQRLLHGLDACGMCEVVGAAERHNQRWNLLERQSAKMTMHGAVAAEDKRDIGLVGGIEFVAGKQVDARHFELLDMVLFSDRSKKGNNAHGAYFRT